MRFLAPFDFQRPGHNAAHLPDLAPFAGKFLIAPAFGHVGKEPLMDGSIAIRIAHQPRFFHGETHDRRQARQ